MRRLRVLLMAIMVLTAAGASAPFRIAAAANSGAYPRTDFTLITPASAIVYATLQSSSARQERGLSQIAGSATVQPLFQNLLSMVLGGALGGSMSSTGGVNIQQAATLLTGTLGHLFTGEIGLAVLPISTTTTMKNTAIPRLHLLLDAGLQSGVTAAPLLFGAAAFGITTSRPSYRGFSIVVVDLNALARVIGKATKNTTLASGTLIPANGPLSSTFYAAVAGEEAVLASDLPTLQAALDTYSNARPSIAGTDSFAGTVGLLPSERFATLYVNLGTGLAGRLVGMLLGGGSVAQTAQQSNSTFGMAISLTAEPHALLTTISAPPSTRSITLPLP